MMCSRMARLAATGLSLLLVVGCSNPEANKRKSLENGKRLVTEKKFDGAIIEFRNAIRADRTFGEAHWRLAQAYEETDNFRGALQEYVRAADLLPDNVEVQVKAATHLLLSQQFEDAKSRADKALAKDPKNADAFIVRANATAGLKDVPSAIKDMEDALKANAEDGRVLTNLGALQLSSGNSAEAEANFKRALQVSPSSVDARLALANFYMSTNRPGEAERLLNEARGLNPAHFMANRMLASFYLTHGRPKEAEAPLKAVSDASNAPQAKLLLADYYIQFQRFDDATAVLKPLATGAKPFAPAELRLAGIDRMLGRKDAAKTVLDRVIQREPTNPEALTTRSSWALQDGDVETAATSGRAATQANADSAFAQLTLGRALAKKGDNEGAIAALREATRINPGMAQAQVLLSSLYLAAGDRSQATTSANEARRAAPNVPDVRLALARSSLAEGKLGEAEAEIKTLLAAVPESASVHALQGRLLMQKRDPAGARAAFTRALDRDPLQREALEGLTVLDTSSGKSAEAAARAEALIAKYPKETSLRFIAGAAYDAMGQRDKVEKAFLSVLEIDPSNMAAYEILGRIYASTGRTAEALKQFEAAAVRQPNQVGAATMVATLLSMQGKSDEAQKRYEAIVAANPRAAVAANNLAFMLAESGGNLDIALQHAQAAVAQLPQDGNVLDTLGWIYYKRNLPNLAIPFLERSVASNPRNAESQLHLGLSYAKAGQDERGRQALETALKLNPKVAHADEARRVITVAASR
jgi:putative PEP-CTERM system TPR-repeat lipoprotein